MKLKLPLLFVLATIGIAIHAQDLESISAKKPIKVSGGLGAQTVFYSSTRAQSVRKPFSYILNGNLNFTLFNVVSVPLSFTYSEQERSFAQPFNQLGFSPTYKGVTVHAGYRSLNWGEYSLAGFNFLLGGAEVQTEKLRAGIVYGRINRATHPDTGLYKNLLPVLKRMGMSAKLGYGNKDNYLDVVFLKAWDVGDSVVASEQFGVVRPSENAVIDVVTHQKFAKYFTLKGELGFSATNLNSNATGSPQNVSGIYNSILNLNSSGQGGKAYTGSMQFAKKSVNAEVGVKAMDLNFKSYGGYFYNTNMMNAFARFGFGWLKNKARTQLNTQLMNDNLNGLKNVSTLRLMPGISTDFNFSQKFGLTLQYNLVNAHQKIENDSLQNSPLKNNLMDQNAHTISFIPRFIFRTEKVQQMIMIIETLQLLKDNNSFTKQYSEMNTNFINITYSYTKLKSGLTFTGSVFNTQLKNYIVSFSSYGLNAGVNKSFKEGKYNTGFNLSASTNKQGTVFNGTLQCSLRPWKKHIFSLYGGLINNQPKSGSGSFTEMQGRFQYGFNF